MQVASPGGGSVPPDLRLRFAADPCSVRAALLQVLAALGPGALNADDRGVLALVLAEVLNNIVEHAYAEATGMIELQISTAPGSLQCQVSDQGAPMPGGAPPQGKSAELAVPLEDLPEGGFGWFMIRSLAHDLRYRRDGASNLLSFCLTVTPLGQLA